MQLADFIDEYKDSIAERVVEQYPPVYTTELRARYPLRGLKRKPMGAQADAIRAAAHCLKALNLPTNIVAEMGTGKTFMALVAAYLAGFRRVLVLCPPHLVQKWARETHQTIPATTTILRTISDVMALPALDRKKTGTLVAIVSREQAKLGSAWRPTLLSRRMRSEATGMIYERPACPTCGQFLCDKDGKAVDEDTYAKKKLTCEWVLERAKGGRDYYVIEGCGASLWSAQATQIATGQFSWGDPRPDDPDYVPPKARPATMGEGPRRHALADYIREHMGGFFDLLIVDEEHEYKGRGSAQGMAAASLAVACKTSLGLTGTIFGGYSSTLFSLLYRFHAEIRAEFGWKEEMKWVLRYGIVERVTKYDDKESYSEDGAQSKRKAISTRTVEKPGVSPLMLRHLLPNTVFLRLKDVATGLPPYNEHVHVIGMTPAQKAAYDEFYEKLYAALVAALIKGSQRLLGAYLQSLLAWPDNPCREEHVFDPDTESVIASAPALDDSISYPKEQRLIELCKKERWDNRRRVMVFVKHTGTRDITPRILGQLKAAGLRAVYMPATVEPAKREGWIADKVKAGLDVLITNPVNVATGLDLLDFPSIVFYQTEYSVYTMRQASRRSWRIGQLEPVNVHFFAYAETLQSQALALIAAKINASLMVEGEMSQDGLAAEAVEDTFTALAKQIAGGDREPTQLDQMFAQARETEDEADSYIGVELDADTAIEADFKEIAPACVDCGYNESGLLHYIGPERARICDKCLAARKLLDPAVVVGAERIHDQLKPHKPAQLGLVANVPDDKGGTVTVSFAELAQLMVTTRKKKEEAKVAAGQLSLFG